MLQSIYLRESSNHLLVCLSQRGQSEELGSISIALTTQHPEKQQWRTEQVPWIEQVLLFI